MEFKKIIGRYDIATIRLIKVYVPIETTAKEEKDEFYEKIGKVCEEIQKHDMLVLLKKKTTEE